MTEPDREATKAESYFAGLIAPSLNVAITKVDTDSATITFTPGSDSFKGRVFEITVREVARAVEGAPRPAPRR